MKIFDRVDFVYAVIVLLLVPTTFALYVIVGAMAV
jgi:hypothetical protein